MPTTIDMTPPAAARGRFRAPVATEPEVRALHAWHRRHRKGDQGWDEYGGATGRDWAAATVAALDARTHDAALDPAGVHVPIPVGEKEPKMEVTAKATSYEHAPFVDQAWDGDAAVEHARKYAGANTPEDRQKASVRDAYAKFFAIVEGDGTKFGDYKYPHHDIVGGKFVTIPKGVSAAIAALNGARGGGTGLSESEKKSALAHLEKHRDEWEAESKKTAARARERSLRAHAFELTSTKLVAAETPQAGERDADGYLSRSVVQVAKVGEYKGHPQGAFEFTPEVFDQMIANHAANPNGIVPFDYEHGSESLGFGSSVFQAGAPAVGWILSLENRGDEGLFATVGWVDADCVEYIRTGRYKFVSPAVMFDATDPVSGESMGPVLVSAAVTNRPFLQGMRPLTARAPGAAPESDSATMTIAELTAALATLRSDARPVQLTDEQLLEHDRLVESLRGIFGLPRTCPESDVIAALDRLEALLAKDEGERDGIDVDALVDSLRWCFNLPRMTSAADVLAEVRKGLAATDTTKPAGVPAATSARHGGGTDQETTMEKSAEHQALESAHEKLAADHKELSAKHASLKGALCKAMSLDPESEESEIIDALENKLAELEKVQKDEAMRAAKASDDEADMVAARLGVTDEDAIKAMRTLRRTNKDAFRASFLHQLSAAPAQAPAAAPVTAPVVTPPAPPPAPPPVAKPGIDERFEHLLYARVAPGGAAPAPFVVPEKTATEEDKILDEANETMVALMRANRDLDPADALAQALAAARAKRADKTTTAV